MRVHIVYCHPSENSLTSEIRDAFLRGLRDSGKPCTISDLYKMGFKTDMSEAEYLRDAYYNIEPPLAPDVLAEQELINAADAIVFIYPVFWTEAPAKLVGWFDRVWSFGFAYGADDAAQTSGGSTAAVMPMKKLAKALVIACSGNTGAALRGQGRLQAMENVMLGDRIYDRAEQKEFVLMDGTERNNAALRERMRRQHLEKAYRLAYEL